MRKFGSNISNGSLWKDPKYHSLVLVFLLNYLVFIVELSMVYIYVYFI